MRVVAVTDVHGRINQAKKLASTVDDFDVLVIAGDITNFSGAETARRILEPLLELKTPLKSSKSILNFSIIVAAVKAEFTFPIFE
jgi:Icc-related predicted phosphoesterase